MHGGTCAIHQYSFCSVRRFIARIYLRSSAGARLSAPHIMQHAVARLRIIALFSVTVVACAYTLMYLFAIECMLPDCGGMFNAPPLIEEIDDMILSPHGSRVSMILLVSFGAVLAYKAHTQ